MVIFLGSCLAVVSGCDGGANEEENDTDRQTAADAASDGGGDANTGLIERCGLHVGGGSQGDAGMIDVGDAASGDVFDGGLMDVGDAAAGEEMDASSTMPDAGNGPMLPEDFSFESDYQMRFTDFAFTERSPGHNANSILQNFLDQSKDYPIIVLLHLDNVEPQAGRIDLRGGAGLKVDKKCAPSQEDCKYKWDPKSPENYREITLDPQTGELRGGLEKLDFIGTVPHENGDVEKFTIPIRDIYFHDAYLRPGDKGDVVISGGRVEGYVTREAAEKSIVKLSPGSEGFPVANLLYQSGQNPVRYDSDGDGQPDAWCLSAKFSAQETTIVSD